MINYYITYGNYKLNMIDRSNKSFFIRHRLLFFSWFVWPRCMQK